MRRYRFQSVLTCVMVLSVPLSVSGQPQQNPEALLSAQRKAMVSLAFMDGVWQGSAWTLLPSGKKHHITQTERIGPFLCGALKVIEGRGYEKDKTLSFNALGIISYDVRKQSYSMRSYAKGFVGDFPLKLNANGFTWEIPAGPAIIRYTAVIEGDTWREVGDRIMPNQEPIRFFEMNLKRTGDTNWPVHGFIEPE